MTPAVIVLTVVAVLLVLISDRLRRIESLLREVLSEQVESCYRRCSDVSVSQSETEGEAERAWNEGA